MNNYLRAVLVLLSASNVFSYEDNKQEPYSATGLRGTFDQMVSEARQHSSKNNFETVMGACDSGCAHLGAGGDADCLSCCAAARCHITRAMPDHCICNAGCDVFGCSNSHSNGSDHTRDGRSDSDTTTTTTTTTSVPPSDEVASSSFGTQLFKTVSNNFPEGNILISPLSVAKALAMVRDGATKDSDNLAQMTDVLGPPSFIEQTEHEGNTDPDVQLLIANSVWSDATLRDSFIDTVETKHGGEAFELPSRYSTVDAWIEENTDGMIKDFLGDEPVPSDIVALLVNAVYFKGAWTYEFDPDKTFDGDFTLRDGSTVPARFMENTFTMGRLWESDDLGGGTAVILDYGKKSDEDDDTPSEFTSMFILPATDDADSMNDVIDALNSQPLSNLLDSAWERQINLKLPRFKIEWGAESLKDTLEDMGMTIAFDDRSSGNFREMTDRDTVYLDDVLHGAVMEVTEEGTEAAAATVAKMKNRSIQRTPPEIIFDRPFVVAIIHRPTGEPVFLGRVENPELDF